MAGQKKKQTQNKKKKQSNQLVVTKTFRLRLQNQKLLQEAYEKALLYPDLSGPTRTPRVSQSVKTVLAQDKTRANITGSAVNTVQGITFETVYDSAQGPVKTLTATSAFANMTVASLTLGTQFPNTASVADANITSACLVIEYMGSVNAAAGEIIVGSVNRSLLFTPTTYTNVAYLPGIVRLPISTLLQGPVRVAMRKNSTAADEFVATNVAIPDCEIPFVISLGLPATTSISVDIVRNWEARTAVGVGVVPYESNHPSYSTDLAAYQDAAADMSARASTLTGGVPEWFGHIRSWAASNMPGLTASAFTSAYSLWGNLIYDRVQAQAPMALGWAQDMVNAMP